MRLASTVSLDFANLKMNAKDNTTNKYVKTVHHVNQLRAAPKDTQRCVKSMMQIMNVGLEKSVPTNIKKSVKSLEQNKLKEMVKQMEIIIKELALKVTCLESEFQKVKLNLDTQDKEFNEDVKSNSEKPLAGTNNSEIIKENPEEMHAREFKCDECEYVVKKKSTLNKHIKTKHAEHECKSCNLKFKTALEALKHTSKDHSSNIQEDKRESESTEKSLNISETHLEVEEENTGDQIESDKFKCKKCKEIFFKKDALIEYTEGGQNMCSLCTILNYGKN